MFHRLHSVHCGCHRSLFPINLSKKSSNHFSDSGLLHHTWSAQAHEYKTVCLWAACCVAFFGFLHAAEFPAHHAIQTCCHYRMCHLCQWATCNRYGSPHIFRFLIFLFLVVYFAMLFFMPILITLPFLHTVWRSLHTLIPSGTCHHRQTRRSVEGMILESTKPIPRSFLFCQWWACQLLLWQNLQNVRRIHYCCSPPHQLIFESS